MILLLLQSLSFPLVRKGSVEETRKVSLIKHFESLKLKKKEQIREPCSEITNDVLFAFYACLSFNIDPGSLPIHVMP